MTQRSDSSQESDDSEIVSEAENGLDYSRQVEDNGRQSQEDPESNEYDYGYISEDAIRQDNDGNEQIMEGSITGPIGMVEIDDALVGNEDWDADEDAVVDADEDGKEDDEEDSVNEHTEEVSDGPLIEVSKNTAVQYGYPRHDRTILLPQSLRRTLDEYKQVMDYMDDDFRSDISLHLYTVHLLHTQNRFYPGPQFTDWPLSSEEIPIPSIDVASEEEFNERFTRYADIHNSPEQKSPRGFMLEFYRPNVSAVKDMSLMFDVIFERRMVKRIAEYNHKHTKIMKDGTRKSFQLIVDHNASVPSELKEKLFGRLNEVLDKLISDRHDQLQVEEIEKKDNLPLDWHAVSSTLTNVHEREQLHSLFSLVLQRDYSAEPGGFKSKRKRRMRLEALCIGRDLVRNGFNEVRTQLDAKRKKIDDTGKALTEHVNLSTFTRRDRESLTKEARERTVS